MNTTPTNRARTIEFTSRSDLKDWLNSTPNPLLLAELSPMTREQVDFMLTRPIDDGTVACGMDDRSEWLWVRFPNGDLMCGFFPHGDSYFEHEAERDV